MSIQSKKPEMPEDSKGQPLYLRTLETPLAKTAGSIATTPATDITLNAGTKFISITVEDYPVYLRLQATASSTNYDVYLLPGQHDFAVGNSVTVISLIARGGASYCVVLEKSSI